MASLHEHAQALAARGFRVFPLQPYGKKPAIGQFNEMATTDVAQITQWWQTNPNYNIGVATTDMVVVDVDSKKGEHAIVNYELLGGHYDTLVVRTASGGIHAYYAGFNSKQGVNILPAIDTRSSGGYVVGPGSFTDPSLANDKDVKHKGHYTVIHDKPLAWVPGTLEAKLVPPHVRNARVGNVEADLPASIAAASDWLSHEPPAVEGQGGDNQTYRVAAKITRDFALTDETAYQVLLPWNETCLPPWPADELWAKVQNAELYATASEGQSAPAATFQNVQVVPLPNVMERHEAGFHLGNAVLPDKIRARRFVADKLLIRGDVSVLAAAGSGGKSAFMLTCAAHFALGLDFGPYKLKDKRQHRIMMYNAEDDIEEQSRRLLAICHVYKLDYARVSANVMLLDDSMGDIIIVSLVNNTLTPNRSVIDWIIETAVSEQMDIIMFDPLLNIHTVRENDNGDMRYVVSQLRHIGREADAAIWAAQHTSKGSSKLDKGDADAIRGAGGLVNSARIAILMSHPDDADVKKYGIDPVKKFEYVRLDDAKTNLFGKTNAASLWLHWESQRILSGDFIGVPVIQNMQDKTNKQMQHIAEICFQAMQEEGSGRLSRAEAVRAMCSADQLFQRQSETQGGNMSLRRLLEGALATPRTVSNGVVALRTEGKDTYVTLT